MDKRFVAIVVAVVLILGGLFVMNKQRNKEPAAKNSSSQSSTSNHTFGKGSVTLIEYGDFECPACGQFFPVMKQVKEQYGDKITFQFRHFPLVQIHPNAMSASRAAEAAAKQGKFWEMHDLLYENQTAWSNAGSASKLFEDYATQLSLNVDTFRKDMSSPDIAATINADIKAGQGIGANSTPTFVLNGKKLEENPRDAAGFGKLIEEAANKKQ